MVEDGVKSKRENIGSNARSYKKQILTSLTENEPLQHTSSSGETCFSFHAMRWVCIMSWQPLSSAIFTVYHSTRRALHTGQIHQIVHIHSRQRDVGQEGLFPACSSSRHSCENLLESDLIIEAKSVFGQERPCSRLALQNKCSHAYLRRILSLFAPFFSPW